MDSFHQRFFIKIIVFEFDLVVAVEVVDLNFYIFHFSLKVYIPEWEIQLKNYSVKQKVTYLTTLNWFMIWEEINKPPWRMYVVYFSGWWLIFIQSSAVNSDRLTSHWCGLMLRKNDQAYVNKGAGLHKQNSAALKRYSLWCF